MARVKKSLRRFSLLLALSMFIGSRTMTVYADDSQTDVMPEVVVSGKTDEEGSYKVDSIQSPKYSGPLQDIPQTIAVVPETVIEEQGVTTLREALRNVPGISIQAGEGGTPAGDQFSIRGFSSRTDLFVDGVRDFGGYTRDSFNFEQVEVTKGPSSSYVGRGSTGGSVNLVSKTPKSEASYEGSLGFGLMDEYGRYTVDVNQPLDIVGWNDAALRVNLLHHDADTTGRDQVENKRSGIGLSLAVGMDSPTRLTASYFYLDQDNVPDYGIPWVPSNNTALAEIANSSSPVAPVDFDNFYGLLARDYEKVETEMVTLLLEHDVNESLTLRDQFRFGENYRDSLITAPRFNSAGSTDIRRTDEKFRDQIDTIISNQFDVIMNVETGALEHDLVTGVEFSIEVENRFLPTEVGPTPSATDLFNPNPFDPFPGSVMRTTSKNKADAESVSIYAFDTVRAGEQWEFLGGLRWERFDVDYTPADSSTLSRVDKEVSWRTGVVYKPKPIGSIYFAYGNSYNPSAEGLTLSSTSNNNASFEADPEQSETYEIGTKWSLLHEKMLLTAAMFRTDKTNARTEDPNDSGDSIVLDGQERVQGFEIGLTGSITDFWKIYTAYTFLDSEILNSKDPRESGPGNELGNTPQNTFSIWSTHMLPFNFEAGFGAQFVDSRYNNNRGERKAPQYWLLEAMLAYQVNENVTMRLNLHNLTDEDYIESVGGGHVIPGPGRSAILSTEFAF